MKQFVLVLLVIASLCLAIINEEQAKNCSLALWKAGTLEMSWQRGSRCLKRFRV